MVARYLGRGDNKLVKSSLLMKELKAWRLSHVTPRPSIYNFKVYYVITTANLLKGQERRNRE